MTKIRSRGRLALALTATLGAAALALSGCSGSAGSTGATDANGLTTLKVATIGLTSDGGLETGIKQGFFKKHGLNIETSIVANPPAGLAAAQSGQVDIAYAPSIPLLNALSQGVPLKVVQAADGYAAGATQSNDPAKYDDTSLYASKASGITSVNQLKGKTIAIPARKAQLEVVIAQTLKDAGVDPTSVNWVVLDFTSAVAALKSGKVDAAGLVSPFGSEAQAEGAKYLTAPSIKFFGDGAVGLWTTGSSTLTNKRKAIEDFQAAIKETNAYANAHAAQATQAGLDYTKSTLKLNQVIQPYWPTGVTTQSLQHVDDQMVQLGYLQKPVPLTGVILNGAQ
ncbi:MAG TPA: ABC transporter substrate-binding protein [Microbacterium sp.]|uniref:ABC transporter substrate-binding protein n=1 Tax=Microbacterium sp. TaxID=51671 RepID=UPI002B498375|nr:ABC transporter substrate-binding protein [Microbacterium sp.]HKT57276.1 ABC transporter substrate-binding protein [Microbacterium sp.]